LSVLIGSVKSDQYHHFASFLYSANADKLGIYRYAANLHSRLATFHKL